MTHHEIGVLLWALAALAVTVAVVAWIRRPRPAHRRPRGQPPAGISQAQRAAPRIRPPGWDTDYWPAPAGPLPHNGSMILQEERGLIALPVFDPSEWGQPWEPDGQLAAMWEYRARRPAPDLPATVQLPQLGGYITRQLPGSPDDVDLSGVPVWDNDGQPMNQAAADLDVIEEAEWARLEAPPAAPALPAAAAPDVPWLSMQLGTLWARCGALEAAQRQWSDRMDDQHRTWMEGMRS